jgi:hypothetical protein
MKFSTDDSNNYGGNIHSKSLGNMPKVKNDGNDMLPTIDNSTSNSDAFASSSSNSKRPKSDYDLTRRYLEVNICYSCVS